MRIDKLKIDSFKNLRNFSIDIDEHQLTSVFIGRNGAGKSNLIEALVIIFRDLDLNFQTTNFSYEITYHCTGHCINIKSTLENKKREISIDYKKTTISNFYNKRTVYLPAHVFAYYSGPSNRLEKHFARHQKMFYEALLKNEEEAIRPLFYARLIHSNFVLLAFFSFFEEQNQKFLQEYFDIKSVESILFILHKPTWAKSNKEFHKSIFWDAKGKVRDFLNILYGYALAPIKEEVKISEGFKTKNKELTYLFIKDQIALSNFAKDVINNVKDNKYNVEDDKKNVEFFKYLESTYLSDLFEEIKIKVKKTDGTIITFNELSEGEQQLLIVLGLLKFTKSKESLFLLDEPDTHLNPLWKFNYLKLIQKIVGPSDNSQVIISTHDPILIGGLHKEAVTIFERNINGTTVRTPDVDPKGLGVAGILTSELFDLPSTLDPDTQADLDRKRQLQFKTDKTQQEIQEFVQLEKEFENYGIGRTTRDPLYDKFIEKLYSRDEFQNKPIKDVERKKMISLIDEILSNLMNNDKKDDNEEKMK